jgi:hypothetical protein
MLPTTEEIAATDIAMVRLLINVPEIALETEIIAERDDAAGNRIGVVRTEAVDLRLFITNT